MVIDGGGFVIRERILKIIDDKKDIQETKEKKNGKAKTLKAASKTDVLEVSTENLKASEVKIKDFEKALSLLDRTVDLIKESNVKLEDVHRKDVISAVKIVIS